MRRVVWAYLSIVLVLGTVTGLGLRHLYAQSPGNPRQAIPSGELIALTSDTNEGRQQVTVIDPKLRVMSVYHIEHASGVITLKSVRSIDADLRMDEFNTESPLPREIRAVLTNR